LFEILFIVDRISAGFGVEANTTTSKRLKTLLYAE